MHYEIGFCMCEILNLLYSFPYSYCLGPHKMIYSYIDGIYGRFTYLFLYSITFFFFAETSMFTVKTSNFGPRHIWGWHPCLDQTGSGSFSRGGFKHRAKCCFPEVLKMVALWNLNEFANRIIWFISHSFWPHFNAPVTQPLVLLCSSVSAVSSSTFAVQNPTSFRFAVMRFAPDGFLGVNSCFFSTRASIDRTRSARASCLTTEQLRYLATSSSRVTCLG